MIMLDSSLAPPSRKAYSVAEFCRLYGCSNTTFYAQVKLKKLNIVKLGRRTLVTEDEATRWLASLETSRG